MGKLGVLPEPNNEGTPLFVPLETCNLLPTDPVIVLKFTVGLSREQEPAVRKARTVVNRWPWMTAPKKP